MRRRRPSLFPWLVIQAASWALAAPASAAAEASSGTSAAGYLAQLLGGLVLVIVFILLFAWLARRLPGGPGRGPSSIQVLAVRNIGARERLILIQVGDEQVLIGATPSGMRTLHRLEHPLKCEPEEPWKGDFGSLLARMKSGGSSS